MSYTRLTCATRSDCAKPTVTSPKHIKAVEEGHEVVITRRGRPVARLSADVGVDAHRDKTEDPKWQAAYERMLRLMEAAPLTGGKLKWTRDEIHER